MSITNMTDDVLEIDLDRKGPTRIDLPEIRGWFAGDGSWLFWTEHGNPSIVYLHPEQRTRLLWRVMWRTLAFGGQCPALEKQRMPLRNWVGRLSLMAPETALLIAASQDLYDLGQSIGSKEEVVN